jgi:hypothetical protein
VFIAFCDPYTEESSMAARVSNYGSKPIAKIMIADDERDITLVLKQGLEQNGFLVKAFTDPEEAQDSQGLLSIQIPHGTRYSQGTRKRVFAQKSRSLFSIGSNKITGLLEYWKFVPVYSITVHLSFPNLYHCRCALFRFRHLDAF